MKNKFIFSKIASYFIFFVFINTVNAQNHDKLIKLETAIIDKLLAIDGDFAVSFKNLANGESMQINSKESFHAASTMKTPVMIEVYKQALAGKFKLSDSIVIKNEFKSIVDGSKYKMDLLVDSDDAIYNKIGKKLSVNQLVYQMITVSSNLATNILIDKVGAKNVKTTMSNLGAKDINVLRGVEDTKAFKAGLNNTTTAYDLMLIFEKLATNKILDSKQCEAMLKILFDQKFNEIIPSLLPKNIKVAHKTGNITGVQHDSGIVYLPNGKKYVIVLLSKNLVDENAGVKALAEVSEMIYKYVISK
jgi:beta-lactamase class A